MFLSRRTFLLSGLGALMWAIEGGRRLMPQHRLQTPTPTPAPVPTPTPVPSPYPALRSIGTVYTPTLGTAEPTYLVPIFDAITGCKLLKVGETGGERGSLGLTGRLGVDGQLGNAWKLHHAYSSLQSFNSDESRYLQTYDSNKNTVLIDTSTMNPVLVFNSVGSFPTWSETDPTFFYQTWEAGCQIQKQSTNQVVTVLKDFKAVGTGQLSDSVINTNFPDTGTQKLVELAIGGSGGAGGCEVDSGGFIAMSGYTGAGIQTPPFNAGFLIIYDTVNNVYGVKEIPADQVIVGNQYFPTRNVHISHSGKYVAINYSNEGLGTTQGTWLYTVDYTTSPPTITSQGILTSLISHGDWAYDSLMNEVYILQGQISRDTTGLYSLIPAGATPSPTGFVDSWAIAIRGDRVAYSSGWHAGQKYFVIIPDFVGTTNSVPIAGGHCSGRANNRKGYALFSVQSMSLTGAFQPSPTALLNNATFSCLLDPAIDPRTRQAEIWCFGRNSSGNAGNASESSCNRALTKVLTNSDWRLTGNSAPNIGTLSTLAAPTAASQAGTSWGQPTGTFTYKIAATTTPDTNYPNNHGSTFLSAASVGVAQTAGAATQILVSGIPAFTAGQTGVDIYRSSDGVNWLRVRSQTTNANWVDTGVANDGTTAPGINNASIAEIFDFVVTAS